MSESKQTPLVALGKHLKNMREQSQQTLAEVSGAVEIDASALERIESGSERPHEDILLLLISYFSIDDDEAIKLWDLADYDGELPERLRGNDDAQLVAKNTVMLVALDMRTMYSDGLDVEIGDTGLTLNFTQNSVKQQTSPVARLGMSYEQAEQVIAQLQQSILLHRYNGGPRQLPPSIGN
ncbi:MAG: helix-turn-helix transcriptional regulator [Candidatus Saccharimonadales bacterium]